MAQVKADALVTMKVSGEDETIGALNRVNKTLNNTAKSVGNTTKTMDGQFRILPFSFRWGRTRFLYSVSRAHRSHL